MRLLFVSVPLQGHVRPLLGLALAARRLGHDVAWATGADTRPLLETFGLANFDAGPSFGPALAAFRAAHPDLVRLPGRAQALQAFPGLFGVAIARPMLPDLIRCIDAWRPDLVISEPAALAAPLAAAHRGVAQLTHDFGLPIPADVLRATGSALAGDWQAAGLAPPEDAGVYAWGAIHIAPPVLRAVMAPSIAPPRRWSQQPAAVCGPADAVLPEALVAFLHRARGRPLVYASFGTLNQAGPGWHALWEALCRATGIAAIVTTGPCVEPPVACPDHVWATPYLPQTLLLPHCTAVVSHGGAGSSFAAAAAGLPQLCLPSGADQFRNADALRAVGAALVVETADAGDIGSALARMLADAELQRAARALGEAMRALPTPDAVAAQLESAVRGSA